MPGPLDISHEVSHALNMDQPVVALESSVIAQGLPARVNVKTALKMEDAVRAAGALPATIGMIEGKVRVGLTKEEIERLGKGAATKLAVRDLPYAVTRKLDGGTTVSATARIAAAAGITVMATGGIGGVHRGFAETSDISADLFELSRTPIVVVCSGAKAVLDVPATAEWLETHGVAVYGLGTEELPAFYSRSSGVPVPRVDGASDLAAIVKLAAGEFGVRSATVVAVPIPEADEIDVTAQIEEATREAAEKGIRGSELTPYLLGRLAELTEGKSIDANTALLKNNARMAAEIAVELSGQMRRRMGFKV